MDTLPNLLTRLARCFPSDAPLTLKPSAGPDAWAALDGRFGGGHAQRWFAASDGQADALPTFDTHVFSSLKEACDAMATADEIRAEPDGYWVEPHWIAITSDGAGQHIMIDDRDGRVLSVAHDDNHVDVLAPTPEAWLTELVRQYEAGTLVWNPTFGLIERRTLDRVAASRAARDARKAAPLTTQQRGGLALTIAILLGLCGLAVWWIETHR